MNDSKSYTFNLFKSYEIFVPEASVNSYTWSKAYIQSQINNLLLSLDASFEIYGYVSKNLFNYVNSCLDNALDSDIYQSNASVSSLKDRIYNLYGNYLK